VFRGVWAALAPRVRHAVHSFQMIFLLKVKPFVLPTSLIIPPEAFLFPGSLAWAPAYQEVASTSCIQLSFRASVLVLPSNDLESQSSASRGTPIPNSTVLPPSNLLR